MTNKKIKAVGHICKVIMLFLLGGHIYACIETFARGYTHWTMFILGGICFLIIGLLNEAIPCKLSITTQALIGAVVITALEFVSGCILNLWLDLNVWSYSEKPYNLLGQICGENCFYWLILSFVGIVIDDFVRVVLFGEDMPKYHL